jgi:insulysin
MLFLGTKKYPDEHDYENFLSQYGGFSNAYTDMEDTNYFFSITTDASECFSEESAAVSTTEALRGALDRFAQFFIAPNFEQGMVDRELRAIDSEYRNGKTSDSWRNFQMLKSVANQAHPFSKFGCGNYGTLTSEGQERLLAHLKQFWDDYYQTYNLRLAVVGHGSLDALQQAVESTFGEIPFSEGAPRRIKNIAGQTFIRENAVYSGDGPDKIIAAFGKEQLGILRQTIPYTETRTIKVFFATPPLDDPAIQSSKPYRALSHFLGHESPGSLHALLNEEGWLVSLSSGLSLDTTDFSLFSLTLGLTPQGMEAKDQVLDLVFQWIALLREQSEERLAGYHDELNTISMMNFRFRENGDPTDFCSQAAEELFEEGLDPSRVLIASNQASAYDPVVERAFLDRLRPENCMVSVFSSDLKETEGEWKTEKWYGAKYTEERISADQIAHWENPPARDGRLQAPALNAFIPTDLSLRCDDVPAEDDLKSEEDLMLEVPKLLQNSANFRLWHKMDRYWRVPKAFVKTSLLSPSTYSSPRSMTLNRLFLRVLNDDLNSFVYDASLAGCNYRVSCSAHGYRISVRGYSEKLPFLLDTLTSRIISLIGDMKNGDELLREKFRKAQQGLLRETKNFRLDSPCEVASYNCRLMLEESVWYLDDYVNEMEGDHAERSPLTMEECAAAAEESLLGRVQCEALCIGNINESEALDVANVLDRHFLNNARPLSEVETPTFRSMKLPTREEAALIFGPDVKKRSVPVVYQELAGTETEENNAIEFILQAGSELSLGYEGLAVLDLISHIAFNSAFGMLRTKEQLGYIVSAHARKTTGGGWGMSIVIQSSVALPETLEERCEAWLKVFRQELEDMTPEDMAQEASAVVAQFLESDTKMSQEVNRVWGEILNTEGFTNELRTPAFDRVQLLAEELIVAEEEPTSTDGKKRKSAEELKRLVLQFFDEHFAAAAPARRVMSARIFSHKSKAEFEASLSHPGVLSTYADIRYVKQFFSSWPLAPYWRKTRTADSTR